MDRLLITGGAGFIGRHIARALASRDTPVTVLDDLSCANSSFSIPELHHPMITLIQGSIFDSELVKELTAQHLSVMHLASVVGVEETISNPLDTINNLHGTAHLCTCLTDKHSMIFGSSADIYGLHSYYYDRPMREDDLQLFEAPNVNRWVYARIKSLEESLVANSAARSAIVRIFNSYGPGMDFPSAKRVIPAFLDRLCRRQPLLISGDGSQMRSLCYYSDTIRGILHTLLHINDQTAPFSVTYNIGSSETISIINLAQKMMAICQDLKLIDEPLPIHTHVKMYSQSFDDRWDRVPDIGLVSQQLGYEAKISLEEGLRKMIVHYRDSFLSRDPGRHPLKAAAVVDY